GKRKRSSFRISRATPLIRFPERILSSSKSIGCNPAISFPTTRKRETTQPRHRNQQATFISWRSGRLTASSVRHSNKADKVKGAIRSQTRSLVVYARYSQGPSE